SRFVVRTRVSPSHFVSSKHLLSADCSELLRRKNRMHSRVLKSLSWATALAFVAILPLALAAQDSAKPASTATADDSPSKWDIFAGYSYLAPHGTSDGVTAQSIDYGAILSVARYFNKYTGVQLEADEHILNQTAYMYPSCASGC